ncbi:uncharacterized protein LOC110462503 [Mizuhopecten yessoensis]|uniref:uncharacterized protein LOC110462503 n=1 Tax=Mizuhopecten yessoensis TaxID=6573 RepID=UPI000B457D50|nr:uncharacterized protein LOC110462503 [Mizuhopecten yessoensis]
MRKTKLFGVDDSEDEEDLDDDKDPDWTPPLKESTDVEPLTGFVLKESMSVPRKREYKLKAPKKQTSNKLRQRRNCPVCMRLVVHMPRHLREVHAIDPNIAKERSREMAVQNTHREKKLYMCPVVNCPALVTRIDMHVQSVHNASKMESKQLSKYARKYIDKDDKPATSIDEHTQLKEVVESKVRKPVSFPRKVLNHKLKESIVSRTATSASSASSFLSSASASASSAFSSYRQVPTLMSFKTWLMSVERGKTFRTAIQHTTAVMKIWTNVDADMDIASIQDETIVRTYWLEPYRETKQPGTLKSMLGSLKEFVRFLCVSKPEGFSKDKSESTLAAIDRWCNTLTKAGRVRAVARSVEDMETQISTSEIRNALSSDHATLAKAYLNQLQNGDRRTVDITMAVYTTSRNFLLMYILAANAQRSGAVCNITLRALEYAKEKDGKMLITIHEHKTGFRTPCILVITMEIWNLIKAYLKMRKVLFEFREDILNPSSRVFLTWTGKAMNQSQLNSALNAFWKEAKQTSSISATKIRKATVTNLRKSNPEMREQLASHMTHGAATADKYYLLHDRQSESVGVANTIAEVMLGATQEEASPESTNPTPTEYIEPEDDEPSPTFHRFLPLTAKDTDTEDDDWHVVKVHGRRSFTNNEALLLLSTTDTIVKGDWSITQKDVVHVLKQDETAKELLGKNTPKVLTDRVRTARKQWKKKTTDA